MPQLEIHGPAGRLEALLDAPAAARTVGADGLLETGHAIGVRAAVVFAHPHTEYGGTMHTKVVYQAAKALSRIGCAVLRFNFRGAGASEGHFTNGPGEIEDFRSALDANRSQEFFRGVTYDLTGESVSLSASPRGDLSLSMSGDFGDEVDYDNCRPGRVVRLAPGLSLKAGRHLRADLDDTYETLDVEGGRLFRAHLPQTRLAWQFNVRAMARAIVSYRGQNQFQSIADLLDVTAAQNQGQNSANGQNAGGPG